MARIDLCWSGAAAPLTITQSGSTVAVGLAMDADGWLACMEVVAARLEVALNAAFVAGWAVAWDADRGKLRISTNTSFNASLAAGFAAWASLSASYTGQTVMQSAAHMPTVYDDQWVRVDLPVRYWHREVAGRSSPVIWDSHWAWDLQWTRKAADEWTIPQMRMPFAVYRDSDDPWALDARGGYIVCRLLGAELSRGLLSRSSGDFGTWPLRCAWLNPTIGVA